MVLNYIWIAFFIVAFIVALGKLIFTGNTQIFTDIINSTFDSSKTAFEVSLGLTGVLSRQCRYSDGTESNERTARTESPKRHSQ